MNFLIALILVMGVIMFAQDYIKSSPIFFYVLSSIISGTEIVVKLFKLPDTIGDIFYPMFANGIISMALFTLVMYASVVPEKSKYKKIISPIRGELSIIASILALGHNFSVGITSLESLKTWANLTSTLRGLIIFLSFTSIAIMIMLLSTSLKFVKSKLEQKKWRKLQKLAYVMYTLIFIQIFLVSIPLAFLGDSYYIINSVVYVITFLCYATLRSLKLYKNTNKTRYLYLIACAYIMVILIVVLSYIFTNTTVANEPNNNVVTENTTDIIDEPKLEEVPEEIIKESEEEQTDEIVDELEEEQTDEIADDLEEEQTDEIVDELVEEQTDEIVDELVDEQPVENEDAYDLITSEYVEYPDGTYYGVGEGREGLIYLSIVIENGMLVDIIIGENYESKSRMSRIQPLLDSLIEAQTYDVDVISGATYSSNGIIEAIQNALTTEVVTQ